VKKYLLALVILACSWAVWNHQPEPLDSGGESELAPVSAIKLDIDSDDTAPSTSASFHTQGVAVNASTGGTARAGIIALDNWHRLGAEKWSATDSPEIVNALNDFRGIWTNGAGTYSALLRQNLPQVLGSDFDEFAAAFASGGTAPLMESLNSSAHITPAWLAWADALSFQLNVDRDFQAASEWLGRLSREMFKAGYSRDRMLSYSSVIDGMRGFARDFLGFEEYQVEGGDSLNLICRKFRKQGYQLSYGWVNIFNGKSVFNTNLRLGQKLKLPTDPLHLEAWRNERVLLLYAGENHLIGIYEASFGKDGNATPLGEFTLGDFLREPVFWQQGGDPVPFGNSENPLGTRWMGFSEDPSYGIHGNTNADDTIGSFESLGCIRMHNSEVEELFELLPRGGKVIVRH